MRYCEKHTCFYSGKKCPKCLVREPSYLRTREEVADPNEWKRYKRYGWVK